MGVTYEHYLIPEDNTYRPGPEELARLSRALVDGGFVRGTSTGTDLVPHDAHCYLPRRFAEGIPFPSPCSAEDIIALGDQDYMLAWPVESVNETGLTYPLTPFPEWGDAYYDLELHMTADFVYRTSEVIEPFEQSTCRCGRELEYYLEDNDDLRRDFFGSYIHQRCPSCGMPFRPQERIARIKDARTGHAVEHPGEATSRFALIVDCNKGFASDGWPIRATDAFLRAVAVALGQEFYQVGDVKG